MTNPQKQIELLELQGNDAELLSLLTYEPNAGARYRVVADQFRRLAVELRSKATGLPAEGRFSSRAVS